MKAGDAKLEDRHSYDSQLPWDLSHVENISTPVQGLSSIGDSLFSLEEQQWAEEVENPTEAVLH